MRKYDVAISFAGEDRVLAEALARALKERGLLVFYDYDEQAELLGEFLAEYLLDLYKNKASCCVVLISAAYLRKRWSRHEWRAAQERALEAQDETYILPVRLDETVLPGLFSTIGHLTMSASTVDEVAELITTKASSVAQFNRAARNADVTFRQGRFDAVIEALSDEKFRSALLRDRVSCRLLVDAYMNVGAYDFALRHLTELFLEQGDDAESQFLAGVCCYRLQRYHEAAAHYERTLALAPSHRTAREDLQRVRREIRSDSLPLGRRLRKWLRKLP